MNGVKGPLSNLEVFEMRNVLALATLIVFSPVSFARADYLATGIFEGTYCTGFIIKSCRFKRIDSVMKNGKKYELRRIWKSVDEYNAAKGLCHINRPGRQIFYLHPAHFQIFHPQKH